MHVPMISFLLLLATSGFMGGQSWLQDKDFLPLRQSGWASQQSKVESLLVVSKKWAHAIKTNDARFVVNLAELPETRQALNESLSNPGDALAQYLFFGERSVKAFLLKKRNLRQKIVRYKDSDTYYACFYDPEKFSGDWSLDRLDGYALDLETVVCESFYVVKGKWYMDFNMPIFTED